MPLVQMQKRPPGRFCNTNAPQAHLWGRLMRPNILPFLEVELNPWEPELNVLHALFCSHPCSEAQPQV